MATELPTINVLAVHGLLIHAGGPRNMLTFAKHMDKEIFDVSILGYQGGGPLEPEIKAAGIPYHVSDSDVDDCLRYIAERKIDVLHLHRSGGTVAFETELVTKAREANPDLIVIEKNVFSKYDPTLEPVISSSMFQCMMHINERYLPASGVPFDAAKHKVFYNMIDREALDQYLASSAEIAAFRTELGIPADAYVIGKVGRPRIEKWSDLILDMMPHLVQLIPNICLVIVGVPESRKRKIARSSYADHVIIIDRLDDQARLHLFYQTIDTLAHSSKIGECNGNAINEAYYWGKPVVVNSTPTRDNGQLEQVSHLFNGIVANTPQSFARAVAWLAAHPEEAAAMGAEGHDQSVTLNDPATMTRQLERIIVELAHAKGLASDDLNARYQAVPFAVTGEMIVDYREEYQRRLAWEFAPPSTAEQIRLLLARPGKFIQKIKDYLDHRAQSRRGEVA